MHAWMGVGKLQRIKKKKKLHTGLERTKGCAIDVFILFLTLMSSSSYREVKSSEQ